MTAYINPKLLRKAALKLEKAKAALSACRNAKNFAAFESAWSDLLMFTGGVLNALQNATYDNPTARQWYQGKKRHGRKDPLLLYMHQARNAEEHPTDDVIVNAPSSVSIGNANDLAAGFKIESLRVEDDVIRDTERALTEGKIRRLADGKRPSVVCDAGGPRLVPVTSMQKDRFQPPTEHNGKKLTKTDPISIAR